VDDTEAQEGHFPEKILKKGPAAKTLAWLAWLAM
jgi:hypothetical protein